MKPKVLIVDYGVGNLLHPEKSGKVGLKIIEKFLEI